MNKLDLALNILQWLICNKTKPNQIILIDETIIAVYFIYCNDYLPIPMNT